MRFIYLTATLAMLIAPLTACKSKSTPAARTSSGKPVVPSGTMREEVSAEAQNYGQTSDYDNFKKSIDDYKSTSDYLKPSSEEGKAFNSLIDKTDALTEEQIEQMVKEGKFTQMEANIEKLEKIELADSSAEGDVDAVPEEGTDEDAAGEPVKESTGKSSILQGTGIYLATTAVLGSLLAGGGAYYIYKNRATHGIQVMETTKKFKDVQKGTLAAVGAAAAASILFPLVVGSMIVADEEPSESTITAAKVALGLGSVTAGIAGIGSLAYAYTVMKRPEIVKVGEISKFSDEIVPGKTMKDYFNPSTQKGKATIAGVVGAAFLGVAIGSAVLASQDLKSDGSLKLASDPDPKAEVNYAIEEFFKSQVAREQGL